MGSLGGGEDLGLSASSLDGGLGLTPFTYVVVGRVTVEKEVLATSGVQTLVSEERNERKRKQKLKSQKKTQTIALDSFRGQQ